MLKSLVCALVTTLAMMGLAQVQAGEVIYSNGDILTMDGDKPSYADEGLLADFVILSYNPIKVDVSENKNIDILETIK